MAVGEIFLAAFLQVLLDRLTRKEILGYFGRLGRVGKKLKKWRKTLMAIAAVLSDAEEKQLTSEAVKLWLNDLKHLAYDIDDLLNTFSNEMLDRNQQPNHMLRGLITKFPHKVKFNLTMNSEIDKIADRLQDIVDQKEKLGLIIIEHTSNTSTSSSSQRPPSSPVLDGPVIGRDEDKRKIVELLSTDVVSSSTNKYQVVAIVGMGGLGKTTLAAQVYNDVAEKEQFGIKIWVSVSDDFNLEKVTRTICQKVTSGDGGVSVSDDSNLEKMTRTVYQKDTSPPCDLVDFGQLQENLSKAINGKRFLIVLDDVWSTCDYDSWTKLQAPFRGGAEGSKLMVTTREEKVAAMTGAPAAAVYYLKTLSDESCLQLFEQHVNRANRRENFEFLKENIIRKCNGLPLAAKALGGVLRCAETGKWEDILNDKLWNMLDQPKILPVLRLSYHHLPSPLKRCFAYCSILPNDYEFGKIQLILLWMAEGFLEQPQGSRAMEDIGEEYFRELLSRSFFQKSGKDDSKYVMHDLVGDLARWAAGDTFARLEHKLLTDKTRHMAYVPGQSDGRERFESVSNAKNLRTFLPLLASDGSEGHSQEDDLDVFVSLNVPSNHLTRYATSEILPKLKYLRVLSLRGYSLTKVPKSIGELRHLRYLNLSCTWIVSLPESTCTLYNLQTLMLDNCRELKTLPSNLSSLSNLRHLYNFNTPSLKEMPPQVGQLTHLQTLSHFVVGEDNIASGIGEIGSLHLRGKLSIGRLENVTDAKRAQLMTKEGLHTLELEWSRTSEKESEVLCSLEPHKKVLELTIKGYHGLELSEWIGNPSFSVMTFVKLEDCKNCRVLPPLGQLPCLKQVYIRGMSSVESVGAEFYGDGCLPFPALETLEIRDMLVWKKWLPCKRDEEVGVFPCLRVLVIERCPKLKKLLPKNIGSLSKLVIKGCEELVVSIAKYKHLRELDIDGCKRVVHRSGVKFELLEHMALNRIPEFRLEIDGFIRGLTKLQRFYITGCEELTCLWENEDRWLQRRICDIVGGNVSESPCSHFVQHLRSLQRLEIVGCSNLICFPECDLPPSLSSLKTQSCNSMTYFVRYQLPGSIKSIVIEECEKLEVLVKDAEELEGCLEILKISECASLTSLSGERGRLPGTLRQLYIRNCTKLESIVKTFHVDNCMEDLDILGCANLISLPEGLCHLSILRSLIIVGCGSLISFPTGGLPSNLSYLIIRGCDKLEALPRGLPSNLRDLRIGDCEKLEALPRGLDKLTSLQSLELSGDLSSILEEGFPPNLIRLDISIDERRKPLSEWGRHQLDRLASLKQLTISNLDGDLVAFPPKELLLPKSLTHLSIEDFPNLRRLSSSFQSLTSLQSLEIWDCPKLESVIPEQADHLPLSLTHLCMFVGCPLLRKRYQHGKGRHWSKIANIPFIVV